MSRYVLLWAGFLLTLLALVPIFGLLPAQVPAPIVVRSDGTVDASAYGVIPGVDCTAALKRLVGVELPADATIQLPAGVLRLMARVDARTGIKNVLHTDHLFINGANGQTVISGNFPGPLLCYNFDGLDASAACKICGITFQNVHPDGWGLLLTRADNSTVKDCAFYGANGLAIGRKLADGRSSTNLGNAVRDCLFQGNIRQFANGIGCALNMIGEVDNCRFFQWGTALSISRAVNVRGGRFENNSLALVTGTAPDGIDLATNCTLTGIGFEANVRPVTIGKATFYSVLSGLWIHGTGNSITAASPQIGVVAQAGSGELVMNCVSSNGAFQIAAVRLAGNGPVVANVVNGAVKDSPGVAWDITMDRTKLTTLQCNTPLP